MLRVLYEWNTEEGDISDGQGWIEYLRSDETKPSCPLERLASESKATNPWHPLPYSHLLGAYVSAHMRDQDRCHRPLPNKVSQWLSGKPSINNIRWKRIGSDLMPRYVRLREYKDEHSVLVLSVQYEKEGIAEYRRSTTGGLGTERFTAPASRKTRLARTHGSQSLHYSEVHKTLVSPALDQCLPNRVVEGLKGICLAFLVKDIRCTAKSDIRQAEDGVDWEMEGSKFQYRFEYIEGGCLFVESVLNECGTYNVTPQALIYSDSQSLAFTSASASSARRSRMRRGSQCSMRARFCCPLY